MARVLLVEDAPDLGLYEAGLIEAAGHTVVRCSGGATPFAACPMMRSTPCPLAESADLILFSCRTMTPIAHRSYRGDHLLRAYRAHQRYGRLPMVVVSIGVPAHLGGTGPLVFVQKFASPHVVLEAVERLLATRIPSDQGGQQ